MAKDLYSNAGVHDDRAEELVDWLTGYEEATDHPKSPVNKLPVLGQVEEGIGGFASVFAPSWGTMKDPLMVNTTDGVGTKLMLASQWGDLEGIGVDLVAMCANDLLTLGARPLGFLDYYATSSLEPEDFKKVLKGIHKGLAQCGCALMGGETAQMPGLYQKGHFDLAGYMFGVVDRSQLLSPQRAQIGDYLYALPSSGFHSNGYSLIREWLKEDGASREKTLTSEDRKALLTPTKIYTEISLLHHALGPEVMHSAAHITGGGLDNISRAIPDNLRALLCYDSFPVSSWMKSFLERWGGGRPWIEYNKVFNLGCGMIISVSGQPDHLKKWQAQLKDLDIKAYHVGSIERFGVTSFTTAPPPPDYPGS